MSMITLFSAFMGLYVIVRLILPSGMNWSLKLILSLFAFACAEKLLLTKLVYGTMGAFMPEPVQLASGYLHSAVTILFLLLVVRDALLLLTLLRSTIGVTRLNFSVRNGKRWIPRAIATLISLSRF